MKHIPSLLNQSIRSVNKLLLNGDTTISALHIESSKIIEETKAYNPFITICNKESLNVAKTLDDKLVQLKNSTSKTRDQINPKDVLYGIPISIKDNFCTDKILTTCASKMLHNFVPNYTATAVSRLFDSNCIMMGKTNMDEFAMGSSSVNSYYGPTANTCRDENLVKSKEFQLSDNDHWFMAGGSSTGSAVSVASGACFASLGTDTGGSTRQPASLTGILGFKPTYGLISRFGLIPLAHCLDVVSILARNVDDIQLIFEAVVGRDENDLTSVDYRKELRQKFTDFGGDMTIRIGVPDKFITKGSCTSDVSDRFSQILGKLNDEKFSITLDGRNVNFKLINLDLECSRYATECYTVISSTEISSNMSCYDGVKYGFSTTLDPTKRFNREEFFKANRDEGFGSEVKKRIILGNYFLMSENRDKYLNHATKLRRSISDEFQNAFVKRGVDIIMTPSTPSTSVSYREWLKKQSDNELFHEDYFLIPANLANLPSISLPAGRSEDGLPIGVQLLANRFHDIDLLFISKIFENEILKLF